MKNSLLLSLLATGTIFPAVAATLTPEQALARFNSNRPQRIAAARDLSTQNLKLRSTIGKLYVFSSGKGFAVLPSEDSAPALLGYSDAGEFDLDSNPSLREWFDFYNRQLTYLKNHPEDKNASKISHKTREEISQLLKMSLIQI